MAFVTVAPVWRAKATGSATCRPRRARTACWRMAETEGEGGAKGGGVETASAASEAPVKAGEEEASGGVPFELRGFSLANVFLFSGLGITIASLSEFLGSAGSGGISSLGFVYGVPIALVGAALKYAELKPVFLATNAKARAARDSVATATQKQIVSDVTRHRYGDESHMQPALSALGLIARGQPCPKLIMAREACVAGGQYALELDFISLNTPYARWEEQVPKYEQFFGPGVKASTEKIDSERRIVRLRLVSTGKL